jgi:hypothetical protein
VHHPSERQNNQILHKASQDTSNVPFKLATFFIGFVGHRRLENGTSDEKSLGTKKSENVGLSRCVLIHTLALLIRTVSDCPGSFRTLSTTYITQMLGNCKEQ